MPEIRLSREEARGCGYRKPGGYYLVCDAPGRPCGRMPIKTEVCPCCGKGIKQTRGTQWVDPELLLEGTECLTPDDCSGCPMANPKQFGRFVEEILKTRKEASVLKRKWEEDLYVGIQDVAIEEVREGEGEEEQVTGYRLNGFYPCVLIQWVGKSFYETPETFLREALRQGISRRLSRVPKNFVVGKSWVFLGHPEAIPNEDGTFSKGIFHAFKPTALEYVVDEKDDEEKLEKIAKRGIDLVRVERVGEQREFESDDSEE